MRGEGSDQDQSIIFNDLRDLLDPKDALYRLTHRIPWSEIEARFADRYAERGRPAKPIRLMVSLLMLKHIFNLSDEALVAQWRQNPYYQFFSGMRQFQWSLPCDASDLVLFRKRIGPEGAEDILKWSIQMNGSDADVSEVIVDTTVQEKNITYPRDRKLYRKVADRALAIASAEGIALRRTYRHTIQKLSRIMINGNFPRARKRARQAERRMRILAGRLVRELSRKLTGYDRVTYAQDIELMLRALRWRKTGETPVYSLHEPHVYCVARGKDRSNYEFGTKVSIAVSAKSGVIVGAYNLARHQYDGHTTGEVLEQVKRLTGLSTPVLIGDKGYRGMRCDGGTLIYTPADLALKTLSPQMRKELRRRVRRRSMVEPIIGHLKSTHRLCRNFLKGWVGDEINVLLAAAGWNLRRVLRRILCALPLLAMFASWRRAAMPLKFAA